MKRFTVKTICKNCVKEIDASAAFCTYCGAIQKKRRRSFRNNTLIALGVMAAFALIIVILNANFLLPWQRWARINQSVIREYASENYPNAKELYGRYGSAAFFKWNDYTDAIYFEQDGLEFSIIAEYGDIILDNFTRSRAEAQFNAIIKDEFLKPRGLDTEIRYLFFGDFNIYPYTEGLGITLKVINQGRSPQEVGWLYDFYKFWKDKGNSLSSYIVTIEIWEYNKSADWKLWYYLNYSSHKRDGEPLVFSTEEEFYNAFELRYS
ncbi:MAG: zinc ribbon domain-containing protein [Oscillospiraceae bacterium]|nr:zinc ribbon domain-containing protein [Oscillospiraceae bacterium]